MRLRAGSSGRPPASACGAAAAAAAAERTQRRRSCGCWRRSQRACSTSSTPSTPPPPPGPASRGEGGRPPCTPAPSTPPAPAGGGGGAGGAAGVLWFAQWRTPAPDRGPAPGPAGPSPAAEAEPALRHEDGALVGMEAIWSCCRLCDGAPSLGVRLCRRARHCLYIPRTPPSGRRATSVLCQAVAGPAAALGLEAQGPQVRKQIAQGQLPRRASPHRRGRNGCGQQPRVNMLLDTQPLDSQNRARDAIQSALDPVGIFMPMYQTVE